MPSDTQKLRILRARTDHDLLTVIDRELDRGFALLDGANSRTSPLFGQAERAISSATALLARISSISPEDRHRIETKATQLRSRLSQVPAAAAAWAFPASFAS